MESQDLNSFFDSRNTIHNLSDKEKFQVLDYLEPIKAFSRATY